jgi:hypothetical protein
MNRFNKFALALAFACASSVGQAGSFATYHPDQTNRERGFDAYREGEHARAMDHFLQAARYADKPAQLAISMMYLHGEGVPVDPVLAYVWADLSAERGYVGFLRYREEVWAGLTPEQQQRAVAVGQAMYAEYGDDVAKKRLNRLLQRGLSKRTGSRTGSDFGPIGVVQLDATTRAMLGAMTLYQQPGRGIGSISPNEFSVRGLSHLTSEVRNRMSGGYYNEAHWKPAAYWELQDLIWSGRGRVEIGPLQKTSAREQDNDNGRG